jgi:DNA-binding LacI/PurR family transcriptional regulator
MPLPTGRGLAALAAAAGVSKSTASRALNGRSSTASVTRVRILALAEKMGFRPNPYLRTLMTQVRERGALPYKATLAWVDCHPDPESWRGEPVNSTFWEGAKERADALGYTLSRFTVASPRLTPDRLTNMLLARGIHGALIVNTPHYLQDGMTPPLRMQELASVLIGSHTALPGLNFAINDTNATARLACRQLRRLGYRRIGLLTSRHVELCVDYGFVGGYASVLGEHGESFPAPVLYLGLYESPEPIVAWIRKHKLDAVLVTYRPKIMAELASCGLKVPEDLGLATTDWSSHPPQLSGVDQQHTAVAAAAVDLLDAQLQRNQIGLQPQPHGALIEGLWHVGESAVEQKTPSRGKSAKR